MNIKYFLILISFVLLASCGKSTVIKGRLVKIRTQIPVPNLSFKIIVKESLNPFSATLYDGKATSDANGEFSMEYSGTSPDNFIYFTPTNSDVYIRGMKSSSLSPNQTNVMDVSICTKAYLKVKSFDMPNVHYYSGSVLFAGFTVCSNTTSPRSINLDSTFNVGGGTLLIAAGTRESGFIKARWTYKKWRDTTTYDRTDTIYLDKPDTTVYIVEY